MSGSSHTLLYTDFCKLPKFILGRSIGATDTYMEYWQLLLSPGLKIDEEKQKFCDFTPPNEFLPFYFICTRSCNCKFFFSENFCDQNNCFQFYNSKKLSIRFRTVNCNSLQKINHHSKLQPSTTDNS